MLTGSVGKPQGTTPLTPTAVAHSSPSLSTVISEVGMTGSLCLLSPRTSVCLCRGPRAGWWEQGSPRVAGPNSPPPLQRTERGPSSGTIATMPRG